MNLMLEKKYLGVDWGEKRIGLATGDSEMKLALPFKTVSGLTELLAVINSEEIDIIVLGSPRKLSGEGANNIKWLEFINNLQKQFKQEIVFWDERLSSKAADALGASKRQASYHTNSKVKAARDEIAAALILQNYFDSTV